MTIRCESIQKWLACRSDDQAGRQHEEAASYQEHLAKCQSCSALLRRYQAFVAQLEAECAYDPDSETEQRFIAAARLTVQRGRAASDFDEPRTKTLRGASGAVAPFPLEAIRKKRAAPASGAGSRERLWKHLIGPMAAAAVLGFIWDNMGRGVAPETGNTTRESGQRAAASADRNDPVADNPKKPDQTAAAPATVGSEAEGPGTERDLETELREGLTKVEPKDWIAWEGIWKISGNRLEATRGTGRKATVRGGGLMDLAAEARIRIVEDGLPRSSDAGLIYRVKNPSSTNDGFDGYYAAISTQANVVMLGRMGPGFTVIQEVDMPIVLGRWYTLKVVASGCSHKVYLDDVLTIDASDCGWRGPGLFGVRAHDSWAQWAGFAVSDEPTPRIAWVATATSPPSRSGASRDAAKRAQSSPLVAALPNRGRSNSAPGSAQPGACVTTCSLPNATASCVAGRCEIASCDARWGNCDGEPQNGCETELTRGLRYDFSDEDHAGWTPWPPSGRTVTKGTLRHQDCAWTEPGQVGVLGTCTSARWDWFRAKGP
ncbi:MAG: hypothetical protein MJD61_01785 [Proteobacteria bacterium]|nr:hypothetical protein [Pseudomonadota bacterium]